MKKCLVVLWAFIACLCFAEIPVPESARDVLQAAYQPEKVKAIHSAKLIYEVRDKEQYSCLVIRAAGKDRIRMDFIGEKEIYSVCRNGGEYWGYETKTGFVALPPKDQREMLEELTFFPLPFLEKADVFLPLTADGTGYYGSSARKCRCYRTSPADSPKEKISVWTDAESGLLCMIKAKCDEGLYATSFLNYQDFNGIRLATRINLASPEDNIRMKLLSADWNTLFADSVFGKTRPESDGSLTILQKNMIGKTAVKPAVDPAKQAAQLEAKKKAAQAAADRRAKTAKYRLRRQIERQEKVVRDLEIRIAAKQKMLSKQETVFLSDRAQASDISNGIGSFFRRAWAAYGWSSPSPRRSRTRRRAARTLFRESGAVAASYEQTSRELTDMQIRLGDAKVELEKLNEEWKKMTEKEE